MHLCEVGGWLGKSEWVREKEGGRKRERERESESEREGDREIQYMDIKLYFTNLHVHSAYFIPETSSHHSVVI